MKKYLVVLVFGCLSFSGRSQNLPTKAEVIETMKRVNDYWIDTHNDPGNNAWARAAYFTGNMAFYQVYPKKEYLDYANLWANNHEWGLIYEVNSRIADDQCVGQTYLDLYMIGPESDTYKLDNITTNINYMVNSSKSDDWDWIDALFMAMPVFTRLGVLYNDNSYFNKMYALYSSTKYTRGLYNSADGLWYQDQNYDPPYQTPNGLKCYWARGDGWVLAALARTLKYLPLDEAHRDDYVNTFKAMAAALKNVQRDDGFWNVSLIDPNDYGGPETSGTGFFAYGIAWGVNNGLLDSAEYAPVALNAWQGLVSIAVHPDGKLGYIQGPGKEPSSAQPVNYKSNSDFGVGAFLLAGSEVVKMASGVMPVITGVEQNQISIESIKVYPNPVQSILNISGGPGCTGMSTVAIYNLGGMKIYETSQDVSFPHQFNISSFSPGIYIVKVSTGSKYLIGKVIKE